MKAALAVGALLAALCGGEQAWACSDPLESHDRRISDQVVEGRIRCDRDTDRCQISVSRSLKPLGRRSLQQRIVQVEADYGMQEALTSDGSIILMCPGPFAPDNDQFYGRFYLVFDEERRHYRVRRHYVRDRDGLFYHLGIKCGPEVGADDGTASRTCESAGAS